MRFPRAVSLLLLPSARFPLLDLHFLFKRLPPASRSCFASYHRCILGISNFRVFCCVQFPIRARPLDAASLELPLSIFFRDVMTRYIVQQFDYNRFLRGRFTNEYLIEMFVSSYNVPDDEGAAMATSAAALVSEAELVPSFQSLLGE